MIMKIMCWCWLTVGSWIMFVFFKIKLLFDVRIFALKCEHVRFLQNFIGWPECPQTEMSWDRYSLDWICKTEMARLKSRVPNYYMLFPLHYQQLHPWEVCNLNDPWSFVAFHCLMHFIPQRTWKPLQFYIIIIMMASFMRVLKACI